MLKKLFLILLLFALTSFSAGAEELVKYPAYIGYVNDYAKIFSSSEKAELNTLIGALERKTTAQIAVVTLATTSPLEIEDYAVRLFEKWGIGQKGKDNGALLLVAVKDRKVRIETGYGLEGALPDAICNKIIFSAIIPYFKKGEYNNGIIAGTAYIVQLIAGEYNVELGELKDFEAAYPVSRRSPLAAVLRLIFTLIFFTLFLGMRMGLFGLLLLGSGRRSGGYWYGGGYGGNSGGFSGGFGGFGGGLSGGGGASGSW